MNKKILAFAVLFCAIISFTSCVDDDDENTVSDEWKTYNDKLVREASATGSGYTSRTSMSGNGSVYWKTANDFIPDTKSGLSTKITEEGTPYSSDSISMRYEGWFYLLDGTKYTFDSTEDRNGTPYKARVYKQIDGVATMLQYMKVGDQVEVCIPYMLGYGTTGMYSGTTLVIPGYTTLWFRIKLLDIYPDNPDEWKKE